MKTPHRLLLLSAMLVAAAGAAAADLAAPFTVQDLVRLRRLSDPRVSPDQRHVVFVLRETDMEANKGHASLWLLDLGAPDGRARRIDLCKRGARQGLAGRRADRQAHAGRAFCGSRFPGGGASVF